ncbi:WD40 repeat-like protein [Pyrenochaeta sp. DS3sAY3a]|nr:WD40 repeat-like protein [Pyrenochaeta sp. DS3sAY3a]
MRLLQYREDGKYGLPIKFSGRDVIPRYAILSHTWGADSDEVTFADLENGTGEEKPGFAKIRLCGDQAHRDGLEYFWIDTCCFDKRDMAETSLAIRSMFRWYRHAARCYVFLSDVWIDTEDCNESTTFSLCESRFRRSRWFTRGWTLQELLAPASVEFFSKEWLKLGDRASLIQQVHEITNITLSALQGTSLSRFTVNERLSWNDHRVTKLPIDKVYSLMGILGVEISPVPGESPGEAHKRVLEEISHQAKCLQDLQTTDPYLDKKRIEETKGGLLKDSYRWVLENRTFQQWQNDPDSQLLWIKGDPGKGKTMLLCGIIDELHKLVDKPALLSYFFCQATDNRINSAASVLRGILSVTFDQQPWLASHVRKKYDQSGKTLFEDVNAWIALTDMFKDVLTDPSLGTTYLIIDALDECVEDLPSLLRFIREQSATSPQIKWIISSRNWPNIEEGLAAASKVKLSLELNAESVSEAVRIFIERRVEELSQRKRYDLQTRNTVLNHLISKADDTFLWVALVCQELEIMAKRHVLRRLVDMFPPGLNSLYDRMMKNINNSQDAEVCIHILKVVALVRRPLSINELVALVEQLDDTADDLETVREIIGFCGSFLTLRGGTIFFVHQTAQDFLLTANAIYPSGVKHHNYIIFDRSLKMMSSVLKRDLYGLGALGIAVEDIKQPTPNPLESLRYCCVYWIEHLCASDILELPREHTNVIDFLQKKYLYWLEALSLCGELPTGSISISKLQAFFQEATDVQLAETVHDARRFLLQFQSIIDTFPLQVYASALFFSPSRSIINTLLHHELPKWTTVRAAAEENWSACLQTLEGHGDIIDTVLFSPNGRLLASGSRHDFVKIWDVTTGRCIRTLEGYCSSNALMTFAHNNELLAFVTKTREIKIWDVTSGTCLYSAELPRHPIGLAFLPFPKLVLALKDHHDVLLHDAHGFVFLREPEDQTEVIWIWISSDGTLLATVSYWNRSPSWRMVRVWDVESGECLRTLNYAMRIRDISYEGLLLMEDLSDGAIKVFDLRSGEERAIMPNQSSSSSARPLATLPKELEDDYTLSPDGRLLAILDSAKRLGLWSISSGEHLQSLEGHSHGIEVVAFAPHGNLLATGSVDHTIKLWEINKNPLSMQVRSRKNRIEMLIFSPNGALAASVSGESIIKIWDACSGECMHALPGSNRLMNETNFSPDGNKLITLDYYFDHSVTLWDVRSGKRILMLGAIQYASRICFSPHSELVAAIELKGTITIRDCGSGKRMHVLDSSNQDQRFIGNAKRMTFSHDSKFLAALIVPRSRGTNRTSTATSTPGARIMLFDVHSGKCLHTIAVDSTGIIVFSPDSKKLAIAGFLGGSVVKIWDLRNCACVQRFPCSAIHALAFTADGKYLAWKSFDSTFKSRSYAVKIVEVESGICVQTFMGVTPPAIGSSTGTIKFNSSSSLIETTEGTFRVQKATDGSIARITEAQTPRYLGAYLSWDATWVENEGERILWIPQEYRPECYAVFGNKIAVGTRTGHVWICRTCPDEVWEKRKRDTWNGEYFSAMDLSWGTGFSRQ